MITGGKGAVWLKDLELVIEPLPADQQVSANALQPAPTAPARSLRRYLPGKDSFISLDNVSATKTAWKIERQPPPKNQNLRLFELRGHQLKEGTVVLKMKLKTEASPGWILTAQPVLEFHPPVATAPKVSTQFAHAWTTAEQNTNAAWYEARVSCREAPGVIAINLKFDGAGTVEVEEVELLHVPVAP